MKEPWLNNTCTFLLAKEKTWKRTFNINSKLLLNHTEKQIMPFKTTVNWLFNDLWYYLVITAYCTPNTSLYKLAKFLLRILSALAINQYTVKDSFAFVKEITKTDCNYVTASLDVERLLTDTTLQGFIQALLLMSIFWKRIEFYWGEWSESNRNCSWGV